MPNSGPYPNDPYGSIPDPSNILGGAMPNFALNTGGYSGPYGQAVKEIMAILKGPNLPAMAGTETATSGADQAAQGYTAGLAGGRADLASRGLSGSGVENSMVSSALGGLQTGEAAAGQAGTAMTQQMRDQLRMMILNQLQKISMGKASAQYGLQSANIGLQSAENAQNSQKLGEMGNIFSSGINLLGGKLGTDIVGNFMGGGAPAPSTPWLDPSQAYTLGGPYGNYMPSSFLEMGAGA